jgi:thiol-disulfide isomerase/thioredoxin
MIRLLCCALAILLFQGCGDSSHSLPGAGQWRVVNYWAIWCAPCREEIPELNALDRNAELLVYAVNYDGKKGMSYARRQPNWALRLHCWKRTPVPHSGSSDPACCRRRY